MTQTKRRPKGVTAVAILTLIGATGWGLFGVLLLTQGQATDIAVGVLLLLLTGAYIVLVAGLLRLKNWARVTLIVIQIINALMSVFGAGALAGLQVILAIIIVIYLFRPHVRAAFTGATIGETKNRQSVPDVPDDLSDDVLN